MNIFVQLLFFLNVVNMADHVHDVEVIVKAAGLQEYLVHLCVCGYHVHQEIWEATIGEKLLFMREPRIANDQYVVAVIKDDTIIGQYNSCVCSLFLNRGGSISCIVSGKRRFSADLPQGGLEIPCNVIFKGNHQ